MASRHSGWARPRPRTFGRALRIAVTLAVLALAIAVPLAVRHGPSGAGRGPLPTSGSGPLTADPLPLPGTFLSAAGMGYPAIASGSTYAVIGCGGPGHCLLAGATRSGGRLVPAYVQLAAGAVSGPFAIPAGVAHGVPVEELACPTAAWCIGVSSMVTAHGVSHVYLSTFDGLGWHSLAAPPGLENLLQYVGESSPPNIHLACTGTNSCLILADNMRSVGNHWIGPTYTAELEGAHWQVLPPFPGNPTRVGYALADASCVNAQDCYAVGEEFATSPRGRGGQVVLHWDGVAWRLATVPVAPLPRKHWPPFPWSSPAVFRGISCNAAGQCFVINTAHWSKYSGQAVDELQGGGCGHRCTTRPCPRS